MVIEYITPQVALIFIAFIITVFILYKLFKIAIRTFMVGVIAFSFPWIVSILKLPLPVTADVQTGVYFAVAGVILYLIYEFFHIVIHIAKLILSPFRRR